MTLRCGFVIRKWSEEVVSGSAEVEVDARSTARVAAPWEAAPVKPGRYHVIVMLRQDGEQVEIDLSAGEIRSSELTLTFPPLPDAVMEIFEAGGLVPYTRERLEARRKGE